MSLEYLLIFGFGIAVSAALVVMGSDIKTFVMDTITYLIN
jgi:hypothetical protein